jgi:predicted small lipoprotein YifL
MLRTTLELTMKLKRLLVVTLIAVSATIAMIGCGHKDPLESAAPPVSSDARGLGNAAGTKPTAGSSSTTTMGGAANAGPAIAKPNAKP